MSKNNNNRPVGVNSGLDDECETETTKLIDENEETESIFLNKYFALALMGFSLIGQNFLVDNPAALEDVMLQTLHISTAQFSSFYSFYNWPNAM